ncbi:MAG: type II secretion system major pseudopilin GspG [Gammaproteobacteria bacterium]|nr:type II secretion system major pseudopilin GspG [Gammaproteobacteria bacterium]
MELNSDKFRNNQSFGAARQSGFSLIEIMVVVVILGILSSYVVLNIMDKPDQARQIAAKNDISTIMSALKLYKLDNSTYPSTEQGLMALVQRPSAGRVPNNWKKGGYLEKLPKDPWGGEYQYLSPGVRGTDFDLFSYGADGQPGGEDWDRDIGNWNLDEI